MKRTLILTGCAASIIALMAFKNKGDINRTAMAEQKTKSIDESNFDKSVKPGDDFYEYVNGNWLKRILFQVLKHVGEVLIFWLTQPVTG